MGTGSGHVQKNRKISCCHASVGRIDKLITHTRAYGPQIRRLWRRIWKDCGWKHPRASSVRWLWREEATSASLEFLEDTWVGCSVPSGRVGGRGGRAGPVLGCLFFLLYSLCFFFPLTFAFFLSFVFPLLFSPLRLPSFFPLHSLCFFSPLRLPSFFILFAGMGVGDRVAPVLPGVVGGRIRSCSGKPLLFVGAVG